jgi:hypothetical protein
MGDLDVGGMRMYWRGDVDVGVGGMRVVVDGGRGEGCRCEWDENVVSRWEMMDVDVMMMMMIGHWMVAGESTFLHPLDATYQHAPDATLQCRWLACNGGFRPFSYMATSGGATRPGSQASAGRIERPRFGGPVHTSRPLSFLVWFCRVSLPSLHVNVVLLRGNFLSEPW